jgi:hypothetical protein
MNLPLQELNDAGRRSLTLHSRSSRTLTCPAAEPA